MDNLVLANYFLWFVAGTLAGMFNAVAGGGSFVSFPALVVTGLSAVEANATSTLALWFGAFASALAYRSATPEPQPVVDRKLVLGLVFVSLLGGAVGASLLLLSAEKVFAQVVPYLMMLATFLFALSPNLKTWLQGRGQSIHLPLVAVLGLQLAIAIYGGYFGGGAGILMLAVMNFMGLTNIHAMNGLKSVLGNCMNGVAIGAFVLAQKIVWGPAVVMAIGAIGGAYGSAQVAQQIPESVIRRVILGVACGMTVYLLSRQ